jgi:N-acetylglucosamine malate deacetylase 2
LTQTRTRPPNLRILTVYAHPDDEAFGPAAALAKYARAGAEIYGIFATSGEEGNTGIKPAPTPAELARLREQDTRDAAKTIGYRDIQFLRYHDGTLSDVPVLEVSDRILQIMKEVQPHVVTTFGPAGITKHPDHVAVHLATVDAFHRAQEAGIDVRELHYDTVSGDAVEELGLSDYPDGQTNVWIDVTETQPVKLEALRTHARHVLDAHEAVERLSKELEGPQWATFHRAWPPVPQGVTLRGFLQEEFDSATTN